MPTARAQLLERLGLLIDQQWNWRESQALARRLKNAKLRGNPRVKDIDYRAARGLDKSVMRALTQETGLSRYHENIFVLGRSRNVPQLGRTCLAMTHSTVLRV